MLIAKRVSWVALPTWGKTKQLSKFTNLRLIKIFLIAENKDELKKRLIKRNQNTEDEIEKRFKSFH